MEKKELIKKLAKDYKKYWEVELFRQQGWVRKICKKCGKAFWTIDVEKQVCGDVPCVDYSFIGKPPTKKRLDYIETWKEIERFFVKNGHHSVPSYPVVCRWFPGLYFTIASIVAFQRAGNDTTFEFPHNPLIIPQACLRFNDIPNVGRTGKHFTNFVMIGQHARPGNGGYWKDRCIELDYRLLTEVFGIKKEDITWIEDAWIGPAAFGYSLEWMVAGLELGNAVFTEFLGTLQSWKKMERPVVDMGAGLERLCWITQGTPTAYEAVFGPVLEKMKKGIDYDKELFTRYARLAGGLNLDDVTDIEAAKVEIAKRLGISFGELDRKIGPLEAIFAIADHIKTLLFAAKDGSIPSNVGGGYNLRVVLRRAIDLREKYNLEIDFMSIAEGHARWLKPLFPDLLDGIETLSKLLSLEEERYKQTKARGKAIISDMLKKGKPSIEKMIEIYESHGVPPEMVRAEGEKHGLKIDIPDDFYTRLSARHMTEVEERKEKIELPSLPPTKLLFYEDDQLAVFEADVLGVFDGKAVVLSQTAFYPEGGGQEADHGWIIANGKKYRVYDVKKIGDVVVHFVEGPEFKKGQKIKGEIDKKRRDRLRRH
ncbi:MAG: alanine--tRNA ligase-related protein, partial [Candidatus Aenigmatarchaeota archaeon]